MISRGHVENACSAWKVRYALESFSDFLPVGAACFFHSLFDQPDCVEGVAAEPAYCFVVSAFIGLFIFYQNRFLGVSVGKLFGNKKAAGRENNPFGSCTGSFDVLDISDRITSYNVCYTKLLR